MKRISITLLAAAGFLAVQSARADHVSINGSINLGGPAYVAPAPVYGPAPGYAPAPVYVAPNGYWSDTYVNVLVPGHWIVRRDYLGREINTFEPAHYERRPQRVWVAYRNDRERWEHERWEHERREHRDWDRR